MSGRQKGSWRERQERDPFVLQARREGWRSRAIYKLEQILKKESLLQPDMTCIDLGAAPGSWSQYVSAKLNGRCRIIALDLLPMDSLPSVEMIQGDFTEDDTLKVLLGMIEDTPVHLVMSDMAPNMSGNKSVDQPKSLYLAELALVLAHKTLERQGNFVCKMFQGQGTDSFVATARDAFERVRIVKPKASRRGSSEVYLVARNYQL